MMSEPGFAEVVTNEKHANDLEFSDYVIMSLGITMQQW